MSDDDADYPRARPLTPEEMRRAWPKMLVDENPTTRDNEKPLTVGKTVRGLKLNHAGSVGKCVNGSGTDRPDTLPHPPRAGQARSVS